MTPILEAARDLQAFLTERKWKFCIIGGIALLRWGEPRFTRDVDVTLLSGFGREDEFIAPLLESGYRGRVPDPAAFARRNRVLLLTAPGGTPVEHRARRAAVRRGNGGTIQLVRVCTRVPVADLFGGGSRYPEALRLPAARRTRCRNGAGAATRSAGLGACGAASRTVVGGQGTARDHGSIRQIAQSLPGRLGENPRAKKQCYANSAAAA